MLFTEVGFGFVVSPLSVHLVRHCSTTQPTLLFENVGVVFIILPLFVHLVRHCSATQLELLFAKVGFGLMISPLSIHLFCGGSVVVHSMLVLVCKGASGRFIWCFSFL